MKIIELKDKSLALFSPGCCDENLCGYGEPLGGAYFDYDAENSISESDLPSEESLIAKFKSEFNSEPPSPPKILIFSVYC